MKSWPKTLDGIFRSRWLILIWLLAFLALCLAGGWQEESTATRALKSTTEDAQNKRAQP